MTEPGGKQEPLPPLATGALAALVLAKLAVHALCASRYGYFRDELYFLDCARHLDFGYVDHAPGIGVWAGIALLFGGSLPVLRMLAAAAGAAQVALTVLLARELGGSRFSQGFAGLCALAAPIVLAIDSLLTMNAFEPLFWTGCAILVARIARTGDSRLWIWFGVLAGLGIENKHSTLFFGAAFFCALLATPLRREMGKPWIWLGGAIAFLLFLPNVVWEARHGWPTLVDLQNVKSSGKNVVLAPVAFLKEQVFMLHPLLLPVWLSGLVSLLAGRLRRFRVLGITYVVFLALMIAMKGKNYYVAPIYPVLFAAGAIAVVGGLERLTPGRFWLRAAVAVIVAAVFVQSALLVLPLLPPERLLAFQRANGVVPPKTEVHHDGPLEQRLGDQFGWPELVTDVAHAYEALPPEVRARTGVFASNYGEAGALHLFGPAHGLPDAICAHQSHSIWGPGEFRGENLIWLQWDREDVERYCTSVEKVGEHFHKWGMAEENRPIWLCTGLRKPLPEVWDRLTHWN
jgi:hypothetical protein